MPRRRSALPAGYSSLEVKCLLIFGGFLVLVLTVSFLLYWYVTESLVTKRNPDTARLLADQALMLNHWQKLEPKKEFLVVVQDITDQLAQQKYDWAIYKPDAPEAQTDELLGKMLAEYREKPETVPRARGEAEGEMYHYYKPVVAAQQCITCHSQLGGVDSETGIPTHRWKEGDLMAVLKVTIPNGPTQQAINWSWNMLLAVMLITAFLGMIAFYLTIRYVVIRPLRHLRDVSSGIGHGNIELRADLHTGDEFEALAISFNRMLRGLVNAQKDLSRANQVLDAKIEELGRANLQLKELNRIKNDFLATMSHELRTPLNSILGFSNVLGSIASLDEKQKRYVENIQNSGHMLLVMINDILDLAKIDSGRAEVKLVDFGVKNVVSAQCDMARPLAEKKNINLTYDVPPDLPRLHLDLGRVQQILNNLLSNAIKFTPEGGMVKVTVEAEGLRELPPAEDDPEKKGPHYDVSAARVRIRVTDSGVGIAEDDLQAIFQKFRQGKSAMGDGGTMTREHSGTGLGLSIVKELCKLMKGEIRVESELGVGSTFTVELPWRLEELRKPDDFTLLVEFDDFVRNRTR